MRIAGSARTITAGGTVTYAARGLDATGRTVVDLTALTTFRITAPGRCSGPACSTTRAGSATVVGTVTIPDGTFRASAALRVLPGPLGRVTLVPQQARAVAGRAVSFRAVGTDWFGNPLGDVSGRTAFTMSAPGSCTGSTCTATKAQQYAVRGTVDVAGRQVTGTATLVVDPGSVATLTVSPSRTSVSAGQPVDVRAQGADTFGNPVGDLTARATFTMTAPGRCTGASCTATLAKTYEIAAIVTEGGSQVRGAAVVGVTPGPLQQLQLDPPSAVATVRAKVPFRAYGTDGYGNRLAELTVSTTVAIGPDGTCTGQTCSAAKVGAHTVTASADLGPDTVTTSADVLVVATDITGIRLNPRFAQTRPDQTATFTAVGVGKDGAVVTDLTRYSAFAITPDGQCTDQACSAGKLGRHTVTGTLYTTGGAVTDVVPVEVIPKRGVADRTPGVVANIQVSPGTAQADAGAGVTYVATGVDTFGTPVADLTSQTTFVMSPDGSCAGATCVATTPGPHTVTGTFTGVASAAPASAQGVARGAPLDVVPAVAHAPEVTARAAGVTVSRSVSSRSDLRAVAATTLTGQASLDVRAGPGSCLVAPADLTTLTVTTQPADGGAASVRVDGVFASRFATCPVVVLVDDRAVQDVTTIAADGTIVAATTVSGDPPSGAGTGSAPATGTAQVTAIDGRPIRQVAFTLPPAPATGPGWFVWLLLALAVVVLAAAANSARNRRQRRWVSQHVLVTATPVQGSVSAGREPDAGPSVGIRLVPRSDPARVDIATEEDR
ncbi:MAG TPA: hypothetical protein VFL38_05840 [Humibacillus xanthopallidus]|nr:hypothetical protein [Humibacillus xanthopallidus]